MKRLEFSPCLHQPATWTDHSPSGSGGSSKIGWDSLASRSVLRTRKGDQWPCPTLHGRCYGHTGMATR